MFQTKGLAVNASQGDRTVHLVELNFTPTAAGKVNETLKIKVQPSGDTVDVKVSANVK